MHGCVSLKLENVIVTLVKLASSCMYRIVNKIDFQISILSILYIERCLLPGGLGYEKAFAIKKCKQKIICR